MLVFFSSRLIFLPNMFYNGNWQRLAAGGLIAVLIFINGVVFEGVWSSIGCYGWWPF